MPDSGLPLSFHRVTTMTCEREQALSARMRMMVSNCRFLTGFILFLFLVDDPGRQHYAVAVVVQLQREDQYIPVPAVGLGGQMGQYAEAAVDGGLPGVSPGADDLAPLRPHFAERLKQLFSARPSSFLL